MSDEFKKCLFCKHYDNFDGCMDVYGCNNYDSFEPNKNRIIEKAKEKHISVSDVIALINLGD